MKHRETSPPVTARVREIIAATPETAVCGEACLQRIARFTETLGIWGGRTNLTAHPNDPVEIAFHVIDSLAPLFVEPALRIFREKVTVLDLGSGAGFPALILAAATDADFTLIEARRKRASFLAVAATEMGLTNVKVVYQRAMPEAVPSDFEVVTSRAVGEASLEMAGKALRPEGVAILWTSPEQAVASAVCRAAGLGEAVRHHYAVWRGVVPVRRSLLIFRKPSV